MSEQKKIDENWERHWREILEKPDGSIDVEQLKKELMDFSDMIGRMTTLTHDITNGRLSYPTYDPKTIMQVRQEIEEEEWEERQAEDLEHGTCSLCDRDFEDY